MQNRPTGLQGAGEWQNVTKTGRRIDVEITSYPLDFQQRAAVLVVARDITESKRAEAALRESEAAARGDRKRVVSGKSVSARVDLGGRRIIKKKRANPHKSQDRQDEASSPSEATHQIFTHKTIRIHLLHQRHPSP